MKIAGRFGDMKDKKAIWEKLNNSGLSLVEVIVSITLLVIVATILLTGVMASGSINAKSADLTNAGYNQAALIEEAYKNNSGGVSYSVVVSSLGVDSVISGFLISSKDDNTGVGFTMFVPSEGEIIIPPGDFQNTPDHAAIGGNTDYVIFPKFTLSDHFFKTKNKKNEATVGNKGIFYEQGNYYITRNKDTEKIKYTGTMNPIPVGDINNYVKGYDDEPNAVKININIDPEKLPPLSINTKPGDIKKVVDKNGKISLYVFFPEDWDDWSDKEDWEEDWEDVIEDHKENWVKLDFRGVD
jgi:type II secretory pathway pseudopilin PulG